MLNKSLQKQLTCWLDKCPIIHYFLPRKRTNSTSHRLEEKACGRKQNKWEAGREIIRGLNFIDGAVCGHLRCISFQVCKNLHHSLKFKSESCLFISSNCCSETRLRMGLKTQHVLICTGCSNSPAQCLRGYTLSLDTSLRSYISETTEATK
jgi:hypothetical protein